MCMCFSLKVMTNCAFVIFLEVFSECLNESLILFSESSFDLVLASCIPLDNNFMTWILLLQHRKFPVIELEMLLPLLRVEWLVSMSAGLFILLNTTNHSSDLLLDTVSHPLMFMRTLGSSCKPCMCQFKFWLFSLVKSVSKIGRCLLSVKVVSISAFSFNIFLFMVVPCFSQR